MSVWLGIDIGGTKTRIGLVDGGGLLGAMTFQTRPDDGPQAWVRRLAGEYQALGGPKPGGAGIACAGSLDRQGGRVIFANNLKSFNGFGLTGAVRDALGVAAVLENDANLYALGEARFGAGRGRMDMACITLGTGVGGGIVLNGRLLTGPMGMAGEIGHMLVESGGRLCTCGARGCLEAYASATGLMGLLAEALEAGRRTSLELGADVRRIRDAAAAGDALALELMNTAGTALGRAFADLICVLGLDLIIMGGGVSPAWPLMADAARAEMARRLFVADPAGLEIIMAQLGEDAPVLGAATLAAEALHAD